MIYINKVNYSLNYIFTLNKLNRCSIEYIENILNEYDITFIGIDVIQNELQISFKNILSDDEELVFFNIIKDLIV